MCNIAVFDWQSPVIAQWQAWGEQAHVSPFQLPAYQQIYWQHFGGLGEVLLLSFSLAGQFVAVGGFHQVGKTLKLLGMQPVLGNEEVTDYGDLVYAPDITQIQVREIWQTLRTWAADRGATTLHIDYVRETSPSWSLWQAGEFGVVIKEQEVAPLLTLPSDWSAYVQALPKKKRDELKRKLRRLAGAQPEFEFEVASSDPTAVTDFLRLHRASDPTKQKFMSDAMAAFFTDLAGASYEGGWQWCFAFLRLGGERVAAVAYFCRPHKNGSLLLYNSGYDPTHVYLGIGFGLQAHLIEYAITQEYKYFDFLRGAERYKFDLGAQSQQLWQVSLELAKAD